jgi:hypothetical protein
MRQVVCSSEAIFVVGNFNGQIVLGNGTMTSVNTDTFILKTTAAGIHEWAGSISGSPQQNPTALALGPAGADGRVYVVVRALGYGDMRVDNQTVPGSDLASETGYLVTSFNTATGAENGGYLFRGDTTHLPSLAVSRTGRVLLAGSSLEKSFGIGKDTATPTSDGLKVLLAELKADLTPVNP